jgi:hypothetical protein
LSSDFSDPLLCLTGNPPLSNFSGIFFLNENFDAPLAPTLYLLALEEILWLSSVSCGTLQIDAGIRMKLAKN